MWEQTVEGEGRSREPSGQATAVVQAGDVDSAAGAGKK